MLGHAFIHSVLNDRCRVVYSEIHDDETAATATAVLRWAAAWFLARGVRIERALATTAAATAACSGVTAAPNSASRTSAPPLLATDHRQDPELSAPFRGVPPGEEIYEGVGDGIAVALDGVVTPLGVVDPLF
jgi:hypothetical protein